MPAKRLTNMNVLCKRYGVEPAEYLLGRLADLIKQERYEQADQIAMKLMIFARHPKGAEPVKEIKNAIEEGRLVVVPSPTE